MTIKLHVCEIRCKLDVRPSPQPRAQYIQKAQCPLVFLPLSISYVKEAKARRSPCWLLQFHKLVMLNTKLPPAEVS